MYTIQILNKAGAYSLMYHCSWTLIWTERRAEGELSRKRALSGNTDTISPVSYSRFYVKNNELMKFKCLIPAPGCSRWVARLIYGQHSVNSEKRREIVNLSNLPMSYVYVHVPLTAVVWTNWTSSQPAVTNNLTWHQGSQTLRSTFETINVS